jgi:histidine triad (HIT) family protein
MTPEDKCIFCKIARKELPSKIVFEDDDVLAFEDIKPQAPVHVVIIPKKHVESAAGSPRAFDGVFAAAEKIAEAKRVSGSGYRIVMNRGRDAGQALDHLHLHLLGARALAWPPG